MEILWTWNILKLVNLGQLPGRLGEVSPASCQAPADHAVQLILQSQNSESLCVNFSSNLRRIKNSGLVTYFPASQIVADLCFVLVYSLR